MSTVLMNFPSDQTQGRQPIGSLSYCAARATPYLGPWHSMMVVNLRIQELTTMLLNGGDPNERDDCNRTPLMYVAAGHKIYKDTMGVNRPGRMRVTTILLKMGADPLAKDKDGNTVLDYFMAFVGKNHEATCMLRNTIVKISHGNGLSR